MKTLALLILSLSASVSMADSYHQGYVRSDGVYVQPHHQTAPDRNPYNNYSTQGNVNPYTGQSGTRDPVQVQQQYAPNPATPFSNSSPYQYREHRQNW